jgi:hypothetical protein
VDVIAVRNDLITIAKAERNHWATHSKYATLDELVLNGDIEMPHREDFTYSAETNEAGFRIVASYSGSDPEAPSRISVDETMTISSE